MSISLRLSAILTKEDIMTSFVFPIDDKTFHRGGGGVEGLLKGRICSLGSGGCKFLLSVVILY